VTADPDVPCSVGAGQEPLAGTAPNRQVWAIVEHPGPWGRDALLDAPWPAPRADLGKALQAAFDDADIRPLLGRRVGRVGQAAPAGQQVVLARTGPGGWAASLRLDTAEQLPDLPWSELRARQQSPSGQVPGWAEAGRVWGVCTQGTRDACCARLGRPLAAAFDALDPLATWEISHSGGHRFAGVALALPEGLVYGRVTPDDVDALAQARAGDRVVRRLLRGAVHLTPAQQCAAAALRDHLDDDRLAALVPASGPVDGPGSGPLNGATGAVTTTWEYRPDGGAPSWWQVAVVEVAIAERPASCGKPAEPARAWTATGVTAAPRPGTGVRIQP